MLRGDVSHVHRCVRRCGGDSALNRRIEERFSKSRGVSAEALRWLMCESRDTIDPLFAAAAPSVLSTTAQNGKDLIPARLTSEYKATAHVLPLAPDEKAGSDPVADLLQARTIARASDVHIALVFKALKHELRCVQCVGCVCCNAHFHCVCRNARAEYKAGFEELMRGYNYSPDCTSHRGKRMLGLTDRVRRATARAESK